MRNVTRLSWIAVGLCSLAAVIQPFTALRWLFLSLISAGIGMVAAGLFLAQRAQRDVEEAIMLEARWREQRERCICRSCETEVANRWYEAANRWTYYQGEPVPVQPPSVPLPVPQPGPEPAAKAGRDLIFEEEDQ